MIVRPAHRLDQVQEYYFSHKLREIAQMDQDGKNVINLGIGKPDLLPPPAAIEAMNKSSVLETSHGYQSYKGIPELREKFSEWYQLYFKTTLDPATEVLPLIGSKEGIMHITMSFLEAGDEVLVPNPGYPAYLSATNLSGAKSVYYNLKAENNWLPDLEEIRNMDLSKVKLMWINYPHMPTGARGSKEIFTQLIQLCKENKILLCHDNPYSFILNDTPFSLLSIDGAKECTIELNSLSKSHNMSGWRLGMLAGKEEYINTVLKFKSNMDSGMFKPLQKGAIAALSEGPEWYETINEIYQKRKIVAEQIIELLGCDYNPDQSGMFLWARISDMFSSSKELADYILYGSNVFITPGSIFGSNGDMYIRISLCQPIDVIIHAVKRITNFLENEKQISNSKTSTK